MKMVKDIHEWTLKYDDRFDRFMRAMSGDDWREKMNPGVQRLYAMRWTYAAVHNLEYQVKGIKNTPH